jgi:RHS repeat-associated protein
MKILRWLLAMTCLLTASMASGAETPADKFKKIMPAINFLLLGGETTEVYNIYADHLNTPRLITNNVGQPVWRYDNNDPFGGNVPDENPSGLGAFEYPLRDESTYFDKETSLVYNVNRYRDLPSGRFIQADPLGLEGGDLSLYVLRSNNPLSFTDPLGLFIDLPSIPQPAVDFLTGVADAASLGLGPLARSALDVSGGVDVCSSSYTAGQYASLFLGVGRLAYAGAAKALPQLVTRGATSLDTALAVSTARNTLKQAARLGTLPNYRIYTAEQVLSKYGADPAAITAAATRTNPLANAVGANLAIGAGVGRATCGCP